ncbi:MAG: CvpA family protein [Sphingobacteriales bacterium]|nr:CvpA family protein [Sphingobacteriales bacterium]
MLIDIAFFVALAYGIYSGWQKGTFEAIASRAKMIVGAIVALNVSPFINDFAIKSNFVKAAYTPFISFVMALGLVMLGFSLLNRSTANLSKETGVELSRKNVGVGLWMFLMAAMFSWFVSIFQKSDVISPAITAESNVYPLIEPTYDILSNRVFNAVPAVGGVAHSFLAVISDGARMLGGSVADDKSMQRIATPSQKKLQNPEQLKKNNTPKKSAPKVRKRSGDEDILEL